MHKWAKRARLGEMIERIAVTHIDGVHIHRYMDSIIGGHCCFFWYDDSIQISTQRQ